MPKFRAITLGPVIIIFRDETETLLRHEQTHVEQWKKDPLLFYPRYIIEFIKNLWKYRDWMKAYRAISYEVQARDRSKQLTGPE
jgi:hypothetical protein